jgi:hypothetical protein
MDILATIASRIPSDLLPDSSVLSDYLTKWKLFIAPLLDPEIPIDLIFDDSSWPLLAAELLVSLVIYEVLDISIKAYLLSAVGSTTSSTGSTGIVKKVVTGPTEAEFFSPKETMSEVIKPGGLFYITKDTVCMLASRLNITLYICPDLNRPVIAPDVHKKPHKRHLHFPN